MSKISNGSQKRSINKDLPTGLDPIEKVTSASEAVERVISYNSTNSKYDQDFIKTCNDIVDKCLSDALGKTEDSRNRVFYVVSPTLYQGFESEVKTRSSSKTLSQRTSNCKGCKKRDSLQDIKFKSKLRPSKGNGSNLYNKNCDSHNIAQKIEKAIKECERIILSMQALKGSYKTTETQHSEQNIINIRTSNGIDETRVSTGSNECNNSFNSKQNVPSTDSTVDKVDFSNNCYMSIGNIENKSADRMVNEAHFPIDPDKNIENIDAKETVPPHSLPKQISNEDNPSDFGVLEARLSDIPDIQDQNKDNSAMSPIENEAVSLDKAEKTIPTNKENIPNCCKKTSSHSSFLSQNTLKSLPDCCKNPEDEKLLSVSQYDTQTILPAKVPSLYTMLIKDCCKRLSTVQGNKPNSKSFSEETFLLLPLTTNIVESTVKNKNINDDMAKHSAFQEILSTYYPVENAPNNQSNENIKNGSLSNITACTEHQYGGNMDFPKKNVDDNQKNVDSVVEVTIEENTPDKDIINRETTSSDKGIQNNDSLSKLGKNFDAIQEVEPEENSNCYADEKKTNRKPKITSDKEVQNDDSLNKLGTEYSGSVHSDIQKNIDPIQEVILEEKTNGETNSTSDKEIQNDDFESSDKEIQNDDFESSDKEIQNDDFESKLGTKCSPTTCACLGNLKNVKTIQEVAPEEDSSGYADKEKTNQGTESTSNKETKNDYSQSKINTKYSTNAGIAPYSEKCEKTNSTTMSKTLSQKNLVDKDPQPQLAECCQNLTYAKTLELNIKGLSKLPSCCALPNQTIADQVDKNTESFVSARGSTPRSSKVQDKMNDKDSNNKLGSKRCSCEKSDSIAPKKLCCDQLICPVNDPRSSTYKFLLKARICCNRKFCKLAAKICDDYEPNVQIDYVHTQENLGDFKYHYWGLDQQTTYDPNERTPRESSVTQMSQMSAFSVTLAQPPNYLDELKLLNAESSVVKPTRNGEKKEVIGDKKEKEKVEQEAENGESPYGHPEDEDSSKRERRASTVSWSIPEEVINNEPHSDPEFVDIEPTVSAEQIVAQATAQAQKFRETAQFVQHNPIFEDILKHAPINTVEEPRGLSRQHMADNSLLFKSQIGGMELSGSQHKTNCCTSLRNKFKRKKKNQQPKEYYDDSNERHSTDSDRRVSAIGEPVHEKRERIRTILNSV